MKCEITIRLYYYFLSYYLYLLILKSSSVTQFSDYDSLMFLLQLISGLQNAWYS